MTRTRTPRLLILAGVLLGLQVPLFLFLAGTSIVLDFMTWGLSDHSPAEDINGEFVGMITLAVALVLGSVLIPLATILLLRLRRWWTPPLIIIIELAPLTGGIELALHNGGIAGFANVGTIPCLVGMLLLLPVSVRRYYGLAD